jgi:hypothetical protein
MFMDHIVSHVLYEEQNESCKREEVHRQMGDMRIQKCNELDVSLAVDTLLGAGSWDAVT